MSLPDPDFYIQDQLLRPGVSYVIGTENPKPDVPSLGVQCCGLYTYSTVRDLVAGAPVGDVLSVLRAVAGMPPAVEGPNEYEVCPFGCAWEPQRDHDDDCPYRIARRVLDGLGRNP